MSGYPVNRGRNGLVSHSMSLLGKAATLNLLYAFPLLLWASGSNSDWFKALAIGFVTWGSGLYLVTGWLYLHHSWRVIHAAR